jgi:hypothetical protein
MNCPTCRQPFFNHNRSSRSMGCPPALRTDKVTMACGCVVTAYRGMPANMAQLSCYSHKKGK